MSDDSIIANCCGACFGTCCLVCCESVLVALNFRKPGSRGGSTQRGCCRHWGEATEDDVFEVEARKRRVADSASSKKDQNGSGDKNGEGSEGEGNGTVTEQPSASPEMAATTTEATTTTPATKPDTGEAK